MAQQVYSSHVRVRRVVTFLAIWLGAIPTPAAAQDRRWEVEGSVGLVAARTAGDGTWTLPPAGGALVTSSPTSPTRQVPSWFFGDGASLLNGVSAQFGISARIAPLEAVLAPRSSARVGDVAVRVRRALSCGYQVEMSVDVLTGADEPFDAFNGAIETARGSFKSAFEGLLATGPFSAVVTNATATADVRRRRDFMVTGAVNARVGRIGRFDPYVTFGGGVVGGTGGLPSATLEGRYRFSALGIVPIEESDRVSLRYGRTSTWTGLAGAGVRRDVSPAWGWRADLRVMFGPDTTRVLFDAQPGNARGTPVSFVESSTNPSIQFSNDPSTGRQSTLSPPGLNGFQAFKGGTQVRTIATIGIFRRF